MGFLDLDKHFAFYAAYHSNPVNITIHMLFVWPIYFTAVLLLNFIPAPFHLPQIDFSLFGSDFILIFNFGFLFTLIYMVFYVCFDFKAGSLAALLCLFCWIASSVLATLLGFQLAWKGCLGLRFYRLYYTVYKQEDACPVIRYEIASEKVVLVVQLISWTAQFVGHGLFERRAPALLDNILQAFLMAPFFVLFEALQIFFGYEPYPGFCARVAAMLDAETEDLRNKEDKLLP